LDEKGRFLQAFFDFVDAAIKIYSVCEYKSYTGMKNRSERKFPCRVQSKMHFFCNLVMNIGVKPYYRENQPALVIEYIKNLMQMFGTTLLMPK